MSQSRRETLNIDLILLHFAVKLIRILQRTLSWIEHLE